MCATLCVYLFVCMVAPPRAVRDRTRTKMERDILADVNHPFIVKLHYGEYRSCMCADVTYRENIDDERYVAGFY